MADRVLVSVLLPAYNCERTLSESIRSICGQTLGAIEVIAVNDGSTDGTATMLDELARVDARIRPVHTANRGIVEALNTALTLARGEYVARMDSDDIAHPSRLEKQVAYLRANPRCVCVGSLFRLIDEYGNITNVQRQIVPFRQTDLTVFPPRITTLPHPSITLRRADLAAMGGYRHGFPHAEDYDLFLRLAEHGELGIVQEHLLDYRVHQSSLSSKNFVSQVDSALHAFLCALFRARSWPEASGFAQGLAILDQQGEKPLSRLISIFHELRMAETEHLRRDQWGAAKRTVRLYGTLLRSLQALWADSRYWRLNAHAVKLGLKIAARRS